jgi:transposase-like protein
MRWPIHPVHQVRPSRFLPPFCPWPECRAHRVSGSRFHRNGWYRKPSDPAKIPRFRCLDCKHTCSRQTFSTTYYLKRPKLQVAIASGLVACSAHRQLARSLQCAKTTVTRAAERLGRHALLFHARCLTQVSDLNEPIVHDHFETFIQRQDHALGIGTAVGADSWFVYDVDPAPHRGSGRRPDRHPDSHLKRTPGRTYVSSIRRTILALIPRVSMSTPLILRVDGRLDYRVAVRAEGQGSRIDLRIYPNPERGPKGSRRSPEALARDRAMAPVDHLHQMFRHSCADQKRETIAMGRRLESIVGRAHLMAVWKNFIKRRRERGPDRSTPAMRLGLANTPWQWERVLSRRLFPAREPVSDSTLRIYTKRWTPGLRELDLKHAA